MKITAIKPAVRTAGRYLIFVDDKYSFSLSETALLESKLISGQELNKAELSRFKQLSSDDKLFGRALALVAARPKTTWEVQMYLQRKGASPEISKNILAKLTQMDLINDASYARQYVSTRSEFKASSRRKLQAELAKKHVDRKIVDEVLADHESDQPALKRLVEQKMRQSKYRDKTKLMQYLARQGFNYEDIKSVIAEFDSESV